MRSTVNIVVSFLFLCSFSATCQEDYIKVFPNPLNDTPIPYSGIWRPIVTDDATIAIFNYTMNTETLTWSLLPNGGLNEFENGFDNKDCDPVVLPDGKWYYYKDYDRRFRPYRKYVMRYDPMDGAKEIVDSFYYTDTDGIIRHPAGVYVSWGGSEPLHIWWPAQNLHHVRLLPIRIESARKMIVSQDGRVLYETGESTYPHLMKTSDLGVSWDTLFSLSENYNSTPTIFGRYINNVRSRFDNTNYFIDIDGLDSIATKSRASSDSYVETPDTLYTITYCGIIHSTLSEYYEKYSLDTNKYCSPKNSPPLHTIARPYYSAHLPDGRTFMMSDGMPDSIFITSITPITVRPFKIDDLLYSCDTIQLVVRGENRHKVTFTYSNNAGMSIAGRIQRELSDLVTFVREPGFTGRFTMVATDGSFIDTIYCADIRNQNEFNIKLYQHYIAKPITGTLLEATPETKPHIALMKWYRNGSPLPWEELDGRSALELLDPIPGRYHAVVMTRNWCATVTDTIEIVGTGINDASTIAWPEASVTCDIVDLNGRFIVRGANIDNRSELLSLSENVNNGFLMVRDIQGKVLRVYSVLHGELYQFNQK
ncbi:MAG: hypothetical protein HQ472_05045 [Ignavibacteria bacterium]|nr:hypothetical protein [Ignavibacteria bacterium]